MREALQYLCDHLGVDLAKLQLMLQQRQRQQQEQEEEEEKKKKKKKQQGRQQQQQDHHHHHHQQQIDADTPAAPARAAEGQGLVAASAQQRQG